MALLDLLAQGLLGLKGKTPPINRGAKGDSTLHYEYSLNGKPKQTQNTPSPSGLDLDGKAPKKYLDNPPK